MRGFRLMLAISAVILTSAGPASAQTASPSLGCIPTSDTPFSTGLSGPLTNPDYRVVLYQSVPGVFFQVFATTTNVSSDGLTTFAAGVPDGLYEVGFGARADLIFLGRVQIGGCAPPPLPVPTSKDQCKDGGWRTFGSANQGQCVASVNRGAKP